jgi:hypothetical protein
VLLAARIHHDDADVDGAEMAEPVTPRLFFDYSKRFAAVAAKAEMVRLREPP